LLQKKNIFFTYDLLPTSFLNASVLSDQVKYLIYKDPLTIKRAFKQTEVAYDTIIK